MMVDIPPGQLPIELDLGDRFTLQVTGVTSSGWVTAKFVTAEPPAAPQPNAAPQANPLLANPIQPATPAKTSEPIGGDPEGPAVDAEELAVEAAEAVTIEPEYGQAYSTNRSG
jgi:hypothetical protein